ncbi:ATP-binding protein [Coleofasciculus sp.]|uniref:ATP-binding protein n=1 Tax=Coleofasciculus sp. TaxID=3100458 RepID=UPI003A3DA0A1
MRSIEAIANPLTHLVRNCLDHGLDTPDMRTAAGKSQVGRLLLRAYHESGHVNIEVSDDGKGIDPENKVSRLEEFSRDRIEYLGDQEVIQYRQHIMPLIHLSAVLNNGSPGFQVRDRQSEISEDKQPVIEPNQSIPEIQPVKSV